jgi:RHS repeat-associated protein
VWTIERDYIYAGGRLLAAETRDGVRHFHLDHLGTPRLITDGAGAQAAFHAYYPFGEEATEPQDAERLKFTGHERDLNDPNGAGDDLDYMHARFYNPLLGRFLSVDSVLGRLARPQSWNRYAYVLNRPTVAVDPDGRETRGSSDGSEALYHFADSITVTTSTGRISVIAKRDVVTQGTQAFFALGRGWSLSRGGGAETPLLVHSPRLADLVQRPKTSIAQWTWADEERARLAREREIREQNKEWIASLDWKEEDDAHAGDSHHSPHIPDYREDRSHEMGRRLGEIGRDRQQQRGPMPGHRVVPWVRPPLR